MRLSILRKTNMRHDYTKAKLRLCTYKTAKGNKAVIYACNSFTNLRYEAIEAIQQEGNMSVKDEDLIDFFTISEAYAHHDRQNYQVILKRKNK